MRRAFRVPMRDENNKPMPGWRQADLTLRALLKQIELNKTSPDVARRMLPEGRGSLPGRMTRALTQIREEVNDKAPATDDRPEMPRSDSVVHPYQRPGRYPHPGGGKERQSRGHPGPHAVAVAGLPADG